MKATAPAILSCNTVQGEDPQGGRLEEKNTLENGGEELSSITGKKSLIIPGSWSQRLVFIV